MNIQIIKNIFSFSGCKSKVLKNQIKKQFSFEFKIYKNMLKEFRNKLCKFGRAGCDILLLHSNIKKIVKD